MGWHKKTWKEEVRRWDKWTNNEFGHPKRNHKNNKRMKMKNKWMCEVIKNDKVLCLKVTPHHLMTSHRQVDKGGIVNKFKTNKRSTKQKEDHRSDDIQPNIEKMITIIVEYSTKVKEEKSK